MLLKHLFSFFSQSLPQDSHSKAEEGEVCDDGERDHECSQPE